MVVYIYTDGSCCKYGKNAPAHEKHGGWAFCIAENPKSRKILATERGYSSGASSNRMELTAVINAMNYAYATISEIKNLVIITDSKYVSDMVYFGWVEDYKNNNFIKHNGEPVPNGDLWAKFYTIYHKYKFRTMVVDIRWVRGHNGNFYNSYADREAVSARQAMIINDKF